MINNKLSRSIKRAVLTSMLMSMGWAMNAHASEDSSHINEGQAAGHTASLLHLAGDHEVTLGAAMTIVAQTLDDGMNSDSGLTYSTDIALEGDFEELGTAFIYINSAQGAGVNNDATVIGVNADNETGDLAAGGYSETRIAEAWFEFQVSDNSHLRVGKIDPTGIFDGNKVANDQTTQFLSGGLVNNPAIAFPGFSAGLNLAVGLNEELSVNIGAFENTDDFDGSLDSTFVITEAEYAMYLGGGQANLRLAVWQEDGADNNNGTAISADMTVSPQLTVALRYGVQDDTQPFDSAASVAGQWLFDNDAVLGAGYSTLAATGTGDDEGTFEVYYSYALSDHLHVAVDVQMTSNPGFDATADDVTAYGIRTQIDL